MDVPGGVAVKQATPVMPELPSTAFAAWDVPALSTLAGVSALEDITGNGNHFAFGAVAPTLVADSFNGRNCLSFTKATTDQLTVSGFFDTLAPAADEDYAIIVVARVRSLNDATNDFFFGSDASSRRSMRLVGGNKFNLTTLSQTPSNSASTVKTSIPNDLMVFVVSHIGNDRTVKFYQTDSFTGNKDLGIETLDNKSSLGPVNVTPTGDLIVNRGMADFDFFGGAYLKLPTQADVEQASAWAIYHLARRATQDAIILFQGDSQVAVLDTFPDRQPSWIDLLDGNIGTNFHIQQLGNGGRRCHQLTSVSSVHDDGEMAAYLKYLKVWTDAMPNKVYCPLMIGLNDRADNVFTLSHTISEIERWATRIKAAGGIPIWLGPTFSYGNQDFIAMYEIVRDRQIAGLNDFAMVMRTLETATVFQTGTDVKASYPDYFEPAGHVDGRGHPVLEPELRSFFQVLA
ncbi:MAG: hypothetical protein ABJL99_10205 [Aliishimia sp.]